MNNRIVWVNPAQCTGCGVCVDICPVNAITLTEKQAHIAEAMCTGCGACVASCPEQAIQDVLEAQVVPLPNAPAPTLSLSTPLARQVATTVIVAGTGLLVNLMKSGLIKSGLISSGKRLLGQWLTSSRSPTISSLLTRGTSSSVNKSGGQRLRRRRRGH